LRSQKRESSLKGKNKSPRGCKKMVDIDKKTFSGGTTEKCTEKKKWPEKKQGNEREAYRHWKGKYRGPVE